jgi:uncharacterized protein YbjT (DUF2867 family)
MQPLKNLDHPSTKTTQLTPTMAAKKILVVFGATGQQGSSVINAVLADPSLSQQFTIRAITRSVSSDKAKQLAAKHRDIELVAGDATDTASLTTALANAHTVFAMTTLPPDLSTTDDYTFQLNTAKAIADVAVTQNVSLLIFSTLPDVRAISGGKFTRVSSFDAKAAAEAYIRSLSAKGLKSVFLSLGSFMENLLDTQSGLGPILNHKTGEYVLARNQPASTEYPLFTAVEDTGKFVAAVLANPDRFVGGKPLCAAEGMYSLEEIVKALSKVTGKTVVYKQISGEEFRRERLPSPPWPPALVDMFVEYFEYVSEFGYFGKDTEEEIKWAKEQVEAYGGNKLVVL